MQFHHKKLANGLQIIAETSPKALSMSLGFFVKTGSRDEGPGVSGVTHFLEHMIFKGTPRRTALEVNRDFDRIGAHYNAFTSEENTVFHAAILPEYMPQAVDILADILRPSLRVEDFDMEKKVIIEEIGMYEDMPAWSAYDKAKQAYFADHPLGNSILGTPESITILKRDQMYEYFQRRYVAANVTVAAAGNFDWDQFVAHVDQHCGNWNTGPAPRENISETPGSGTFQVVTKGTVKQEHVLMIAPAPTADSPLRHAAGVLAVILGDDSGSRLYWALVDPGLAESADASFHDYDGAGSFLTSFSCEPGRTEEDLAIIHRVLREVQEKGVTEEELSQAKSKVLSRVVRGGERPHGRMQTIGMDWTYLNEYRTVDDELKAYEAVTLQTIREVLDRYPLTQLTTLALGPLKNVKNGVAPLKAKAKPVKATATTVKPKSAPVKVKAAAAKSAVAATKVKAKAKVKGKTAVTAKKSKAAKLKLRAASKVKTTKAKAKAAPGKVKAKAGASKIKVAKNKPKKGRGR